ncbi:MAG: glycosyltransferase family 4 protein [Planctomycetia bacterium]|nr:glycosyltransferase family 4 protein [Planctomycetia bacterium]
MKIGLNIEWIGARRGGAEKYAGSVARALIEAGHDVHLFARGVDAGEVSDAATVHEVAVRELPLCGWLRTYRFAAASERALLQEDFDLIIGFNKTWYQDIYLAVAGAHPAAVDYSLERFRHPLVRALHVAGKALSPKQWFFKRIETKQFGPDARHATVVAPSELSAEHFRQYYDLPAERIAVVYNGLEPSRRAFDGAAGRKRFRREQRLETHDVALLFTARNYALKGLEPLLEAFAQVAGDCPQAMLIVCGSRRDHAYQRQAAKLGIADRVRFLGFVDDVQACFAGCDAFVFPTFYDPCSLVVPEALGFGLPVITTQQNGASELLTEGRDGFIVESPWQTDDLAQHMTLLCNDDALRHRMAIEARRTAARSTMDVRMRELVALLERHRATMHATALQGSTASSRNRKRVA